MSEPKRTFLDWSSPPLPEAARWLIPRLPRHAGAFDGRSVLLILPGRRAGRLMLSFLLDEAERSGATVVPPLIWTPGMVADRFLAAGNETRRIATDESVIAAWIGALRIADPSVRSAVLPDPPAETDWLAWHGIARSLERVQSDLAAECKTFRDVAQMTASLDLPREAERWAALEAIERQMRGLLSTAGLVDPIVNQRERIEAGDVNTGGLQRIVLIGVPDLNQVQKRVLRALDVMLDVIIFAPEQERQRFDEFGGVIFEQWRNWRPSVRDEDIVSVNTASEQGQAVLDRLYELATELPAGLAADEVTVGLGDETLAMTVGRAARWAGLHAHDAAGIPLSRTAPARLLDAAASWLRDRRFTHLATLLRHPDVEAWFAAHVEDHAGHAAARESWITFLDRYYTEHLHDRFDGERFLGTEDEQQSLRYVFERLQSLLKPLAGPKRALGEWVGALREVLLTIYGDLDDVKPVEELTADACVELVDRLERWRSVPSSIHPQVDGAEAIRFLFSTLHGVHLPVERRADAIEMIGWLELALDPAPHLILTGFHDGAIPSRAESDPLLPDAVRGRLGLFDNARRYARDAYLLEVMLHSRASVRMIAGRRDAQNEPLTPSRLLLAGDDETVLRRVRLLCAETETSMQRWPRGLPPVAAESKFVVPDLPPGLTPPSYMNVTDFRLYLACPYRYALQRLLRLEPMPRESLEMDPLRFGSLAHEVLERFGRDPAVREMTDAKSIRDYLLDQLSITASDRFGGHPLPAVRVQLARLAQRLRDFADKQAAWRSEGWRIEQVERRFRDEVALDVPGQEPMPLRASIDRIDRHESTGVVRIIDYKTSESGAGPHETHHGRKSIPDPLRWHDLQLPLYHHLLRMTGFDGSRGIEIGYITLPKQTDGVAFRAADWTQADLDNGVETAREIVRAIRTGDFALSELFSESFDPWARLCHAQVLSVPDDESTEDEEGDG